MSDPAPPSTPPRRGNRGRGRGGRAPRGGRSPGNQRGGQISNHRQPAPTLAQQSNGISKIPQTQSNGKEASETQEEDADGEVCFICASPVIHTAIAPCNHRTCHICSLRMRALYKNKACAHCRTDWDFVIFTNDEKNFQEFDDASISFTDSTLGIKYESKEIQEDTLLLLRYNCPDPECDVACLGWPDLHRHVREKHNKTMCDLCVRNKKVFTHEHELYTKEELKRHQEKGDDKPGTVDQSGFRGHPKCGFCRQHFYSDDELYTHCREKHEKCHICDRLNPGRPQYYLNYDTLEEHFRKDHYVCLDQECLEKKFVVFESEMDLRAHQLESHPNGLTKDHRRVDLSDFSLRERYQPARGGRGGRGNHDQQRGGGGRGRGRDPNAEPLPASSAQPLRRDELAFQRQMAIQNAQSHTGRSFGGQLSSTPQPARPSAADVAAARSAAFPALGDMSRALPSASAVSTAPPTREEEQRQQKHASVTERAINLVKGDQLKLNTFRTNVSSYKNSSKTAAELIESFFILFDTTGPSANANIGKLVKELADIFEIDSKKQALLKAWNDHKAINEDYPFLPGSSSRASSVVDEPHGGTRVLRLKSSTAQSSRSSRTASWGTAAPENSSSAASSLFPSLPVSSGLQRPAKGRQSATPWAGSSAAAPSSTKAAPARPAGRNDASAFPALPAAAKPTLPSFTPGYTGAGVRRVQNASPGPAAWGPSTATAEAEEEDDAQQGRKKQGRQGKKVTLFKFG
ncbi:hypothetical protein BT63DRAFT_373486 [Microthyrium microscopicum]|uniref:RING-type E3 ubiquitin transferase n=1 Tax=Microthyrium microscopicum TaxID=703497 RepID=A0A6A6UBM7_9PEZI|nr:hypothetical protein BT63DRAFT_373486 [Microthyrium microscopicum]